MNKKIKIADFKKYQYLSQINISPNGKIIAFIVTKIINNEYVKNLHIINNNKENILIKNKKIKLFRFLNDNQIILVLIKNKKQNFQQCFVLCLLELSSGKIFEKYETTLDIIEIKKIDDDNLLITANINIEHKNLYKKTKKRNYEIFTESPFLVNGVGICQSLRTNLFIFNLKNNKITRLLDKNFSVSCCTVVGDLIYLSGNKIETCRSLFDGIYTYNLKNNEFKKIIEANKKIYFLEKIKNEIIVFASEMDKYDVDQNPYIYHLDIKNNQLKLLNEFDESLNSISTDVKYGSTRYFKSDGNYLYFLTNNFYQVRLKKINTNGVIELVINNKCSINDFDVVNGKIIYSGLFKSNLEEIYEFKNGYSKKITELNTEFTNNHFIQKPCYLKTIFKKEEIDGWILYPRNFNKHKKYPGILKIHGGPKSCYGEIYFHEMQLLSANGYFVFFCNPHGSDGKGNKFAFLNKHWGDIDYQHIMAFVKNVLKKITNIDSNKLGCIGGSYGGYMCNWILTHSKKFKAIVSEMSVVNWISLFGTSDIPPHMDNWIYNKHPYSIIGLKKQWDISPLKYVKNAKTPTLFICGDEDYRCPASESYQLYTALCFLGVETKMILFHGENHDLSRSGHPNQRIKRLKEIISWFQKYLIN